jgi:hypothetical protein
MNLTLPIDNYPVWEISGFDLLDVTIEKNAPVEYEFQDPLMKRGRVYCTISDDDFYTTFKERCVTIEEYMTGDQILLDCPEVKNMWFNMLYNFRWPTNNPVIIIDKPGFYMDPHIDNRNVLGILIINLQDNPEGSGTRFFKDYNRPNVITYTGPVKKGTGIFMLNNWNTMHSIRNDSDKERIIAYRTITLDNLFKYLHDDPI